VKIIQAFFISSIFIASSVQADTIRWTLQDVLLSDGQSATGSFDYDTDTSSVSNISLFTSGSANWDATYFNMSSTISGSLTCTYYSCLFAPENATTGSIILEIALDGAWDRFDSLDTYDIYRGNALWRCGTDCLEYNSSASTLAEVIDGSITGALVPIPAAFWLFGSALAGLGWMRRKQTI
jgi:hypothetical protein